MNHLKLRCEIYVLKYRECLNVEISSAEQVVIISSVAVDVVCCPADNHSSTQNCLGWSTAEQVMSLVALQQCNCGQVLLSSGHNCSIYLWFIL